MAKNSLTDLLAQKAALDKKIADMQRAHRSDAIAKVKAMMAEYGLTAADIGGVARQQRRAAAAATRSAAAPAAAGAGRLPASAEAERQCRPEGGAEVPQPGHRRHLVGPRPQAQVADRGAGTRAARCPNSRFDRPPRPRARRP